MKTNNEEKINEWLKNNKLIKLKAGYAEGTVGFKKKIIRKSKPKKVIKTKPDNNKCIMHWSIRYKLQRKGIPFTETTTNQEAKALLKAHKKAARIKKKKDKKDIYKIAKMHEELDKQLREAIIRDKS